MGPYPVIAYRPHPTRKVPRRTTGSPLVGVVDLRRQMRDPGQLCFTVGDVLDDLQNWLDRHWKIVIQNSQSPQLLYSRSCGDCALFFLIDHLQGKSMNEFLKRFDKHNYVHNDHKVGQMLKTLIKKEVGWKELCKCHHDQDTCASFCGVRHLLL